MSGYGILDYEGMNQAIYRGATSNIVVDTQKMGIGIGVDQNGPSSNLHVVGNTMLLITIRLTVVTTTGHRYLVDILVPVRLTPEEVHLVITMVNIFKLNCL
jgi:hypothetical protein